MVEMHHGDADWRTMTFTSKLSSVTTPTLTCGIKICDFVVLDCFPKSNSQRKENDNNDYYDWHR